MPLCRSRTDRELVLHFSRFSYWIHIPPTYQNVPQLLAPSTSDIHNYAIFQSATRRVVERVWSRSRTNMVHEYDSYLGIRSL
jgi:hypothetical protein